MKMMKTGLCVVAVAYLCALDFALASDSLLTGVSFDRLKEKEFVPHAFTQEVELNGQIRTGFRVEYLTPSIRRQLRPDGQIFVIDMSAADLHQMTLYPDKKLAEISKTEGFGAREDPYCLSLLSQTLDDPERRELGQKNIDGQEVFGLRSDRGGNRFEFWVDESTGLPVQMIIHHLMHEQQRRIICSDFDFEPVLDEAGFKIEVPAGYEVRTVIPGAETKPSATNHSQASVAVLLEQGIYTEETVGDLPRAIEIYSEIVADNQANRKYVAEALFRLGRCHEASGDKTLALKELYRLIEQYPEQKQLAEKAGQVIASLDGTYREGYNPFDYYDDTHIVTFKAVHSADGQTIRGLLDCFNRNSPRGTYRKTHHFRTVVRDNELIGKMCVNPEGSIEALVDALKKSGAVIVLDVSTPSIEEFLVYTHTKQEKLILKELFPELRGCRLVYEITLQLKDSKQPYDGGRFSVYQTDRVAITSQVDPALEDKIERFEYTIIPIREGLEQTPYSVQHFPGTTRTVPAQSLEETEVGLYRCRLVGYKGDEVVTHYECLAEVKAPLYSQLSVNDIQSNGDIRFYSAQQSPDVKRKTTSRGFINSDFVHIEKMFDADGNEIEFTEKHEGRIYRYHARLNEPVYKGETLFMGTSGTKETLVTKVGDNTFRYRMNHSPSAGRPTHCVKIYRLPKGAELVSTNPDTIQHRVLEDGRVELLVDAIIPAGGSLLTEFEYGFDQAEEPLTLLPAPWKDGEALHFRLLAKTGVEMGRQIWRAHASERDGQECWTIEQRLSVPVSNLDVFSRVVAEKESFAPLTGRTKHQMGDVSATYTPNLVKLQRGDSKWEVKVVGPVFDNEQAMYVIRRLPLADGYRAEFRIMSVLSGSSAMEVRIEVTGREEVAVPAGTFDCWKLDLSVYAGSFKAIGQEFWFTVDGHCPVKAVTDQVDLELDSRIAGGDVDLKAHEMTLNLPDDWFAYELASPGRDSEIVRLLPPEMKLTGMLCKSVRKPITKTAAETAESDLETLKGYFKGYTVREDSVVEKKINGIQAALFTADYEDMGTAKVEMRAYYVRGSAAYWYIFRMDPDTYESVKPEIESLIEAMDIPLSAEAEMQTLVRQFLASNWRDIKGRKDVEWGPVQELKGGKRAIRYDFKARIWDGEMQLFSKTFVFNKKGKFISVEDEPGYPKPLGKDRSVLLSPQEEMQSMVRYFLAGNWRDIKDRQDVEWGPAQELKGGKRAIRYDFKARVWDGEMQLFSRVFIFDDEGRFISADDEPGYPKPLGRNQ